MILLCNIVNIVNCLVIALTYSPFWVRLYNLPLDCRTEKHIRTYGGNIGKVLDVEYSGVAWDKSARIKVLLDVSKPLRRILKIRNTKGSVVVVELKYERLPIFCYACGHVGHIERDCGVALEGDGGVDKQWGTWLRASPRRGRLQMEEEARVFLKGSKALVFDEQVVGRETGGDGGAQLTELPKVGVDEVVVNVEAPQIGQGPGLSHDDANNPVSTHPLSFSIGSGTSLNKGTNTVTKRKSVGRKKACVRTVGVLPKIVKNDKRKMGEDMLIDDEKEGGDYVVKKFRTLPTEVDAVMWHGELSSDKEALGTMTVEIPAEIQVAEVGLSQPREKQ